MKKLKRSTIIMAAICALAMAFTLAACSPAQKSADSESDSQATEATETAESDEAVESDEPQAPEFDGAALTDVNFASMKGPTSIGLAYLMQNDWGKYTICAAADEVTPLLLQDKVQIACVPANVASMLYNKTEGQIRVLDINTLGVLYVVTGDLAIDSIEKLAGHTIYMTGKGTVPEYTVRAVLEAAGVPLSDVNLEFKSEPAEVAALLNEDSDAIGILPQPYATAATMKTRNAKQTIDLTQAWADLTGGDKGELVTGVTIAKADFVDSNPDAVDSFLEGAQISSAYANEHPDQVAKTVVDLGIIENEQLAEQAIPQCNVVCCTGDEMKRMLSGYLETLYSQDPASVGGKLPADDFYYVPAAK